MSASAPHELVRFIRLRASLPNPAARRVIREAGGLAQADLAHALGVTAAAISRWEAGTRSPRREHLIAYATLLARLERAVHNDRDPAFTPGLRETSTAGTGRRDDTL
jgi:transcriptional regulator with XRE-family HTH domain